VADDQIRVVLVGTERVTRAGLRLLINRHPGLRVVAEIEGAGDLENLLSTAQLQVVVVIDLDAPDRLEVVPDLRHAEMPTVRVIVLTSSPESNACAIAIERGALGVVSKQEPFEVLIKAIERVHAGEAWLHRATIASVVESLRTAARGGAPAPGSHGHALLPRERQIIALVGQGLRNNEIARTIFVSEATVRNCLGSVFRKLGITNRVHLMVYAIQHGFVDMPASGPRPVTGGPRDHLRLSTFAEPAPDDADES
jgi:two-component system nitrate/nitrite response regulator NarL